MSAVMLALSVTSSSCATMRSNPFIGGSIGGTTGAVAGAALGAPESSVSGAFIGAGVGIALGALIGVLTSKSDSSKSASGGVSSGASDEQGIPVLTAPQVRRTWIKDHVENDQFVKGHYIYSIERSSQWINP
ncbi:MAG: TraV family lipoprotein [Xanthomonadaceae bacterium]|nr:TraV family lipoprotein [Xanthomonadaceae bacterium]